MICVSDQQRNDNLRVLSARCNNRNCVQNGLDFCEKYFKCRICLAVLTHIEGHFELLFVYRTILLALIMMRIMVMIVVMVLVVVVMMATLILIVLVSNYCQY